MLTQSALVSTGFMGAMISNLAFVFRNIFSKKGMKGTSVSGMNYYACLSMMSLVILTPFAVAVEGPQLWVSGWQKAVAEIGPHFAWYGRYRYHHPRSSFLLHLGDHLSA